MTYRGKNCLLIEHHNNTTGGDFKIRSTTFYVSLVNLPINDNINLLKHLKQGFRKTVSWNKYGSGIRAEPKDNNLDCMIDSSFRNFNRFFVYFFKNGNDDPTINSFDKCYIPRSQRFSCIN